MWRRVEGDEAERYLGAGSCRSWPSAPFVLRAVKPFQSSEHVNSEADLSMEMSPLEGQVCLHTASGYTSATIVLF